MADGYDQMDPEFVLRVGVAPPNADLDALFGAAWPGYVERDWAPILRRSLTFVCGYCENELAGFVNVAWDGGIHAFLLDTTVHPKVQRRGLGTRLVRAAAGAAAARGIHWLHVDYEPHLHGFYQGCGFAPTDAGLLQLHGLPEESR